MDSEYSRSKPCLHSPCHPQIPCGSKPPLTIESFSCGWGAICLPGPGFCFLTFWSWKSWQAFSHPYWPAIFHTYWRFFSIFGFPLWKQIYRKPVILMQRHRDIPALSNLNGDHDIATRFLKIDFSCPDLSLHRKWRRTKEPLDESGRREWKSWLKTQPSEN